MVNRIKMTAENKEQFCRLIMESGGIVGHACTRLNISRTCAYAHRADDAAFSAAWDAAVEAGVEVMVDRARERALEVSDTLMIFMLKNLAPDRFRDRRDNVNQNTNQFIGKDGQPVDGVAVLNLTIGDGGGE